MEFAQIDGKEGFTEKDSMAVMYQSVHAHADKPKIPLTSRRNTSEIKNQMNAPQSAFHRPC